MLIALVGVVVAACNNKGIDTPDDNKNDYEQAVYTVTFNTNGDVVLSDNVVRVSAGEKVSPPTVNGEEFIPVKKGYTFRFWSADGTKEWDFDSDTVNKNITLTAVYSNNVYTHNFNIFAKLEYGVDHDGNPTYSINEAGYTSSDVVMSAAELNPDTTSIKSTYNGSLGQLAIPTVLNGDDAFCFWYYLDSEGKPVQFTKWADEGDASVVMLSKYYFTSPLTLYPMYRSNLPRVNVIYRDSNTEAVYDSTHSYAIGDEIPTLDKIADPQKAGYIFKEWYYVLVDDEDVEYEYNFVFGEDDIEGTSVVDAADISGVFVGGELRLYARWQKVISIASKQDYLNVYDTLHIDNPTDEQSKAIEEILGAIINISSIDFAGAQIKPLFDEDMVFTGSIDGGIYNQNHTLVSNAVISNAVISGDSHASLFGYVAGDISNIDVQGISFNLTNDVKTASVIATKNTGSITNCNVTLGAIDLSGTSQLDFGGIAGVNNGSNGAQNKGYITNCSVKIASIVGVHESITLGGISARSNSSSYITGAVVDITIESLSAIDDNISSNGLSSLNVGGIVANNGGTISMSKVKIDVRALSSEKATQFGGVAAINTGTISRVSGDVTLASSANPALVGASISQVAGIGGIAGKNEGILITSCVNASLYARAINSDSIVTIGGLVGNNYSDRRDSQSSQIKGVGVINSCYVVGNIVLDKVDGASNVTVYCASLAGRNSQSKLAKNFAIVDISITNDGVNNVGYLFGSMEKKSVMNGTGYYAKECTFVLNGEAFAGDNLISLGVAEDKSSFSSATWLENSSTVAFDSTIWLITDGQLPTIR